MVSYPKDWETVELNKKYKRVSGTPITAEMMANIACAGGNIAVYAGGNTKIKAKSDCIQNSNIINDEVVIVQSRGIIDFIFSDKPCTFKNEFWGYIGDKNNSVKFLYYLLKNNVTYFRTAGEGRSSFSQITKSVTENYSIPNIKITEQQAIVDALTAFDTHINNLAKLIEKKKMIRDGAVEDLVSGKRRLAGFSGKWEYKHVSEVTREIITGGTPSTNVENYWDGEIPWLASTEIHQKKINKATRYITKQGLHNSSAKMALKQSVLIALAGQGKTRGRAAILEKNMAINQSLAALISDNNVDFRFIYYAMEISYDALRELSSGDGGRGGLNKKLIRDFIIAIPTSLLEQQAIADILTAMDKEISDLEEEKEKYIALKAGAMDDLLTGKIRLV
ncbi:MAG: restriction endonuclease subunit S [Lactobacillus iners]|nr:restriction endonuclease subunit S [Lactobacillus iners]MCT7812435.1 restriction endonuclease subunit S [Lactobacillus iners]MCT7843766.1 restriction endonuclease subunit S [Lactobacillus iners]